MNFCVLVKVSKLKVSFWYQTEKNPYAPLKIKESNEVPFYFYVNGNEFIFGNAARDRYYSNDPNAYGNYFEIVKDPSKHFNIYGNKKPIKQLFYYGIEQYLSYFINTVLYKNDSIEPYRPNFPLRFIFETDIEDKEKSLIESLFTESGYDNVERIDYYESLFEILKSNGVLNNSKSVLLLNGIDNILYLELFKNLSEPPEGISKLNGQGADPRVKILAEMILEYIIAQNSYLTIDKEKEIAVLLACSTILLENITPIIKGEAELSDGKKYFFRVNERNLNERLHFYSNDNIIYTAIDDLLKSNNLKIEETILLLGSEEINTSYFLSKLLKKYSNVKGVDFAFNTEAMKLIFAKITESGYSSKSKAPITPPILQGKKSIYINSSNSPKPILPPFGAIEKNENKTKVPPILPPKKETQTSNNSNSTVVKPNLPEIKKNDSKIVKQVNLPPLPPKKKT